MPNFAVLEDRLNTRATARVVNAVASWAQPPNYQAELNVVFDNDTIMAAEGAATGRNPVSWFVASDAPGIRRGDSFAVTQRDVTTHYWVLKCMPDGTGMMFVQLTAVQP
jgi:hypothetical protein